MIPEYTNFNYTKFNEGSWFYSFKLEDSFVEYLWNQVQKAEELNESIKHKTSGVISKILKLEDPDDIVLDHVFMPFYKMDMEDSIAKRMGSAFNQVFVDNKFSITPALESLQVNFQKKCEFNPLHTHKGLFSFVIWMYIPYEYEDELKNEIAQSNVSTAVGNFQFVYSTSNGLMPYTVFMNRNIEKHCALFPSNLAHQVYPFYTSDDTRISIAGNIYFKVDHYT